MGEGGEKEEGESDFQVKCQNAELKTEVINDVGFVYGDGLSGVLTLRWADFRGTTYFNKRGRELKWFEVWKTRMRRVCFTLD